MFISGIDELRGIISKRSKKFEIDSCESATWKSYYRQYMSALNSFITNADKTFPILNSMSMPFLFLFRHSVELMLKANLDISGKDIPKTHSLKEISKKISEDVWNKISEMKILDLQGTGKHFRYWYDDSYKKNPQRIDVYPSLMVYQSLTTYKLPIYVPIKRSLLEKNNKFRGSFYFYEIDIRGLGVLQTMYQEAAIYLLHQVDNKKLDINNVYIPILFMLRHSIELVLKSNLQDIKSINIMNLDYPQKEHSIEQLFSKVKKTFEKISNNLRDVTIQKDISEGIQQSSKIIELANNIDCDSFYLRYPIDKSGNIHQLKIHKNAIFQWLELHLKADSFLNTIIPYLQQYGYLFDPYIDYENQ